MPRILVVDDQDAVRSMVRFVLEEAGYDLVEACDGSGALSRVRAEPFDVVVSDIAMPGIDGVELLRAVHERDPDLPVVLMTGEPTLDTAMRAVEYGALRYLTKPFLPDQLVEVVEHAARTRARAVEQRDVLARSAALPPVPEEDAALRERFERALATLWLAYQPIVCWSSRRVFGWEALLRSSEPSLPSPLDVLAAARRLGGLARVGARVRDVAAATARTLPPQTALFVNLDPADLDDPDLYDPQSPLSRVADRVVLEITEGARLGERCDHETRVGRLRALGFRIAIDDLGAGYAALTSFAQLSPEIVKVDMSIVRDVHLSPTKSRLVASLAELCREMDVRMVVEGIETPEERARVVELGCDLLQGYLFARPERNLRADVFQAVATCAG